MTNKRTRKRLSWLQKLTIKRPARKLIAECFRDANRDPKKTRELFEVRAAEKLKIDPFTIMLLVRIFAALIQWWLAVRIVSPNHEADTGEPELDWNMEIEVGE